MTNSGNRLIHIKKSDGVCMTISIPSTAVITYGNLHPGSKGVTYHHGSNDDKYVLRIYEGTGVSKRQTAVFRGVDQFVDGAYDISVSGDYDSIFPTVNSAEFVSFEEADFGEMLVTVEAAIDSEGEVLIDATW
jgi:hypothetical protein